MNVRRREGMMDTSDLTGPAGEGMKNAVTNFKHEKTQAKPITNTVNKPSQAGVSQVKNTVNGPKRQRG